MLGNLVGKPVRLEHVYVDDIDSSKEINSLRASLNRVIGTIESTARLDNIAYG